MLLAIFVSLIAGCTLSEKIPIPSVKKDVFIYDEDNIIDDDIENNVNKMLVELEKKTGVEFAVISVQSLLDRTIEDYANNLFNTLGIGKKGEDNGILLLFSRADNKVRLEIGRGLEGCLNDAKCGRILDDFFVPYRELDEYSTAAEYTVYAVLNVLCKEYDITITGFDEATRSIQNYFSEDEEIELTPIQKLLLLIGIIVGLIILEFITGYLFGDGFGDGIVFLILSSGSSGGGGFGGGFSGGGGASR